MKFNVINAKNANELNSLVRKDCLNIAIGGDSKLNRTILENKNVNMLVNAEENKEDFMHSRNSGLNQVLVKLAKRNNISIGFSFNNIIKLEDIKRANVLGKIMQNVMLCNKYKVKMYIVNFINNELSKRSNNDLKDLGLTLGMLPGKFDILEVKNEE